MRNFVLSMVPKSSRYLKNYSPEADFWPLTATHYICRIRLPVHNVDWLRSTLMLAASHYQLRGVAPPGMDETRLHHKGEIIRAVYQELEATKGNPPLRLAIIVSGLGAVEVRERCAMVFRSS